jgi:hypothetical protein
MGDVRVDGQAVSVWVTDTDWTGFIVRLKVNVGGRCGYEFGYRGDYGLEQIFRQDKECRWVL